MDQKTGKKRTKAEMEMQSKEEALSSTLLMLDEFAPIIPDAVTDYHLARGGFQTDDVRIKRILALATQKFISDIATDAIQFARVRQQAMQAKDRKTKVDKKTVLTMDDLSAAMAEHGVTIKKPDYYF
ncbi:Transcription initiation factor TFIID subunit 10 [Boothiomyces macroporosus]|uniref:Transcription initiation factor TFIID subunit 10 n=1 Tax=Boothiomyces macroporosus TaxID=261099 RepID=A0AAD5UII3_9FUNG|nr:Transcription initiation factor TFIID subunit 10 [Boothiomyces macroporosus]